MTMLLLLLLPLQLFALFMFLPIPEELYEFLKMFGNSQALLPLQQSLHGPLYFISQYYSTVQMSDVYIVGFLLLIDFSIGKACFL